MEKYKECHAKVWPEVLKQIKDSNIEDCEFLNRFLFWFLFREELVYFEENGFVNAAC